MRPTTLRALQRAAQLACQNRLVDAWLLAEPIVLTANAQEIREVRRWLAQHFAELTTEEENA